MPNPVLDIEALADKIGETSIGALSGAFQTDQANVREVTAVLVEMAMRFHFDAESLYRQWDQEVFSEVTQELGDFRTSSAAASESDWECLEAKICTTLLFESSDKALKYLPDIDKNPLPTGASVHGMLAMMSPDATNATYLFEKAIADNNGLLRGLPLLFCGLSLVQSLSAPAAISQLSSLINKLESLDVNNRLLPVLATLREYSRVQSGDANIEELKDSYDTGTTGYSGYPGAADCPWLNLVRATVLYWLGENPSVQLLGKLQRAIDQATMAGVKWYAIQAGGLLRRCGKQRDTVRSESSDTTHSTWLADLLTRSVDWQTQLQKIDQLCAKHSKSTTAVITDDIRLAWFVKASPLGLELQPRQQKRTSQSVWSKGRKVELPELLNQYEQLDFLCESDRQLCSAIDRYAVTNINGSSYHKIEVTDINLLNTLMTHPRVFRTQKQDSAPLMPCTIALTEPHLEVLQHHEAAPDKAPISSVTVRMSPYPSSASQHCKHWQIGWTKPDCLQITTYKSGLIDIAQALTEAGLQVPSDGLLALKQSMPSLSSLVTIYSDTEMPGTRSLINQEPDNTLHFYLTPTDEGLRITLNLMPFGDQGLLVTPGVTSEQSNQSEGSDSANRYETLLASIDDSMHKLCRDLEAERQLALELTTPLPMPHAVSEFNWLSQQASEEFSFIASLQGLADREDVQVHWPSAQAITVSGPIECLNMQIHIGGSFDWLHLDGSLQVHKDLTLDLDALFRLLNDDHGHYIQPDENTVIELCKDLHSKLCGLRSIYNAGRVHPLSTAILQEAIEGMTVSGDTHWQDRLQRLQEAESLQPQPPADLAASLRDYQMHGFQWMVRLAHWGAGACLADDMGLGKTFQAIAVVLYRASEGPTLVAAPTSVCTNWINECHRFAPSLNVQRLAERDRDTMLCTAGAGDVIVCSYGVLQNAIDSISEIRWTTIVADEAQSFKNTNTYRSDAMMTLQADFKLITTGTPIENRLEELWNLFRFINPELLGTRERFKIRFANPIENSNDEAAREQLKALVRPFILRRLKSEVLTELPSRTEITQLVELEPDERAFYESLRTDASERIKQLDSNNPEQRFQVLAELTRLRRACCHPKLVTDEPPVESAKLRAFTKLVDELRTGGHRSLVFSQFVGHLALIREYLDTKKISYQYLDGSTSVKQRQLAVDNFQNGEGDLFLISLKAGNSGLNLTAADYVIHMDPWWNPAVEDQASDRAYRMGQTRPVTIYRLVIKNSIEEQIVRLHGQKRELSDGLLDGTDKGMQLSVDELMELVEAER